jgi:hypothetical protein
MGDNRGFQDAGGTWRVLDGHEGYVGQVFEDGTIHGGGLVTEVNARTVAFRAACDCGWLGETILPRVRSVALDHDGAWPEWEQVPGLEAEWTAHTDPLVEALAREHGVDLASPGPDPLMAVRLLIQEAGAQLAGALQACDGADAAEIRELLVEAARLIGLAEVRTYPVRQHCGKLTLERTASQTITLWARWRVVDETGDLVGLVVEERAWLGQAYGPPTFAVVHNPSGGDVPARWRSDGHPTPMVALASLVDRLERR